jgi:predicted MFS family arabinose efflux permease
MRSPSAERAVALLSFASFASSASLRGTDALLPLLAAEFGTTAGNAAAVITAFSIAYGLLQVVHGPIGDKVGKYQMIFVTTALSTLGTIACALAPSLEVLVVARFAAGATVGAIIPLAMAWIGDVVPYARRQSVLARFLIGQMTGVAAGASLGGILGEHFGWRSLFFLLTAIYAVVSLLLWMELRGNPVTQRDSRMAPSSIADGFRRMGALLPQAWVRTMLLTVFAEGALFYGSMAFVAFHLHRNLGVGLGASGGAIAAFAVGGLLYAAVSKKLVTRLGERGLALAGGLTIGGAFLGLALAPSAVWVLPCLLALGGGLYMLHNTLQVNATQMAPDSRGAAVALFALSLFCGQSVGVSLGGMLVDKVGTTPLFLVSAIGLPLLALDFRRRLARRAAAPA